MAETAWKGLNGARRVAAEFKALHKQIAAGHFPQLSHLEMVNDNAMLLRLEASNFDEATPAGRALNQDLQAIMRQRGPRHGSLLLEVSFPDDYPTSPFFLRMVRPRCHMYTGHVTAGGSICIEALTQSGSPGSWRHLVQVQKREEEVDSRDENDCLRDVERLHQLLRDLPEAAAAFLSPLYCLYIMSLPACSRGPVFSQRSTSHGFGPSPPRVPSRLASPPGAQAGTRANMTSQMKNIRGQMSENEELSAMMAGMRGSNIDESDFAAANVRMNLVEIQKDDDDDEQLPLDYEPAEIASYWGRRPVSIITRMLQLMTVGGGFITGLAIDTATGKHLNICNGGCKLKENEVARAIDLRNIMTSLGPAYIKLGQALSIRPDLLSPPAMNELQKLCDKVPSFDNKIAMAMLEEELGMPWQAVYSELTEEPIAAASLGQMYKGKLKGTGEVVAIKVQRPYVLETTVTIDLYIIRQVGLFINKTFPKVAKRADIVALLDEWAARWVDEWAAMFFEELDYVREGENALKFAEQMKHDLPQVVVPFTHTQFTSRRVLTAEWLDGEKLSQSKADDVGQLVNIGVICFLKQLLETGFFHADPHPGNLIRTPDGRLAILDFGLMTQVDDNIKYGMIEAISHLIHRDYDAIVEDFVTLDFIPPDTDLRPIVPVLARELAADLAQITFDYPFRIPPYFALIIRAISTLEGIALVGNDDFALVDEAYPYIARRLLTDDSPRLREALRYMVYGKSGVFDADRLIDLLGALEDFNVSANSARGDLDLPEPTDTSATGQGLPPGYTSTMPSDSQGRGRFSGNKESPSTSGRSQPQFPGFPFPFPFPFPGGGSPFPVPAPALGLLSQLYEASPVTQMLGLPPASAFVGSNGTLVMPGGFGQSMVASSAAGGAAPGNVRESLRFMFSAEGVWFREFIMEELVKSIDALSRDQFLGLVRQIGMEAAVVPIFIPGASRSFLPLAPTVTEEDRAVVTNVAKMVAFLTKGEAVNANVSMNPQSARDMFVELLPILPSVAFEILPELAQRLVGRISARAVAFETLPELAQRLVSCISARAVFDIYGA
eukprot:gene12411-15603_t